MYGFWTLFQVWDKNENNCVLCLIPNWLLNGQASICANKWMNKWMNEQMNGWTNEWMNEWMDEHTIVKVNEGNID